MPCNCCGPQGCFCKVNDSTEPNGFVLNPFAYGISAYWIHCQYPVPISQTIWDTKLGVRLAPNHIINRDENGDIIGDIFFGDYHYYTRSGRAGSEVGGEIAVDHWNGDNSNPPQPNTPQTLVQFHTDTFEKKCRLLARSRVVLPSDENYYDWPTEEELPFEVIDTVPYNAPFLGTKTVSLPFEFGGGVTGVELLFHCGSFDCSGLFSIQGSGAASYVNANMMSNADKCASYGKFKGTFLLYYENADPNTWQCNSYINEKTEIDRITGRSYCNGQFWNNTPDNYPGTNFVLNFFATSPPDAECNTQWKLTYTDLDGVETIVEGVAGNVSGWSYFLDDPFTLNITSNDSITFKGMWVNASENMKYIYDCEGCLSGLPNKCLKYAGEPEKYNIGTVTVTRV